MFSALLTDAAACKSPAILPEGQKRSLLVGIYHTVQELVNLAQMAPDLDHERRFMAKLQAGLEHCLLGNKLDTAAVWVHNKLMSTTEQGSRVDMDEVDKEIAGVTKFLGGPRSGGDTPVFAHPYPFHGAAPLPVGGFVPHFGGAAPQAAPPARSYGQPRPGAVLTCCAVTTVVTHSLV